MKFIFFCALISMAFLSAQAVHRCNKGNVVVETVQKNTWIENGKRLYDYNVKIINNSGRTITKIVIEPNANIRQMWNLERVGGDALITYDWMVIEDGDSSDGAGFITVGESKPTIRSFKHI